MALTRAQLIQGDSSQGTILSNTVQGVKGGGAGITIANDGTISFSAATSTGVVKLNNGSGYNSYVWPSAAGAAGSILYAATPSTLSWTTEFVSAVLPKATAAAVIPAGLESQRPGSPVAGLLRFNTESLVLEYYTGSGWSSVAAAGAGGFVSGTKIVFAQAAAPSGWVQVTDATYNDAAIRLVNSTGGGTGGTVGFTTAFASQSVPLLQHTHVINNTAHSHSFWWQQYNEGVDTGGAAVMDGIAFSSTATLLNEQAVSTSTPGITAANAGTAGAAIDLSVKYVNMIVATKS